MAKSRKGVSSVVVKWERSGSAVVVHPEESGRHPEDSGSFRMPSGSFGTTGQDTTRQKYIRGKEYI